MIYEFLLPKRFTIHELLIAVNQPLCCFFSIRFMVDNVVINLDRAMPPFLSGMDDHSPKRSCFDNATYKRGCPWLFKWEICWSMIGYGDSDRLLLRRRSFWPPLCPQKSPPRFATTQPCTWRIMTNAIKYIHPNKDTFRNMDYDVGLHFKCISYVYGTMFFWL